MHGHRATKKSIRLCRRGKQSKHDISLQQALTQPRIDQNKNKWTNESMAAGQENLPRMVRWHCPPDTGFEIWALAVWVQASYLSVSEAPHNTECLRVSGDETFCLYYKICTLCAIGLALPLILVIHSFIHLVLTKLIRGPSSMEL